MVKGSKDGWGQVQVSVLGVSWPGKQHRRASSEEELERAHVSGA